MLAGRRGDIGTRKRVGLGWIALERCCHFVVFIIDGMVLVQMDGWAASSMREAKDPRQMVEKSA